MSIQLDSSLLPERSHARVPFITVQASLNASISLNGLNISVFQIFCSIIVYNLTVIKEYLYMKNYPMVSPVLLLENIRSYCYSPIILIKTNQL